jgi:hypothetical protein
MRTAPPRLAETSPMPVETNTSHTDKRCGKTLQEHPRSCKALGATPTAVLARPTEQHNNQEGRTSHQRASPFAGSYRHHHGGSGATVRDGHKGPLMTRENPLFRKITKRKRTYKS